MRVLIVAEDPTLDRYILQPIVERIFDDLGRSVRVDVLTDPHLSGADQALDAEQLREIVQDYPMIHLFLLCVDRDCDRRNHVAKVRAREAEHPERLVGVLAREEVEVWALALHRERIGARWSEVRDECDPKERFWDPFVRREGWVGEVGRGRKRAMRGLGSAWSGLLATCPEIAELRERLRTRLEDRSK